MANPLKTNAMPHYRHITTQHIKFLKLLCSELTYREIAIKMKRSPRTIDGYRDQLFAKLKVRTRTSLVLYALKYKLVTLKDVDV